MVIPQNLCLGIGELALLLVYVIFDYSVTHSDDFYQARRWKAAILISIISGILILVMICTLIFLFSYDEITKVRTMNLDSLIVTVTFTLAFVIPLMFIITVASYNRLVWSDDLLDKIRNDPSKGKKSPIQRF